MSNKKGADEVTNEIEILRQKLSRRQALSTGAKIGSAFAVGAVLAGVGGYFSAQGSQPTPVTEKTVTKTATVENTETIERTATKTKTSTETVAKTATVQEYKTKTALKRQTITKAAPEGIPSSIINKKHAGKTIRVASAAGHAAGIEAMIPDFTALTGINVELEKLGVFEMIERQTLMFNMESDELDIATWFVFTVPNVAPFCERLEPYVERFGIDMTDFPDWLVNMMSSYDPAERWTRNPPAGQPLYGLPLGADGLITFTRKDLFEDPTEKANFEADYGYELPHAPKTWKETADVAEFFTRPDDDLYGGPHLPTTPWEGSGESWLPEMFSRGGYWVNEETGVPTINSAENVEAMNMHLYFVKNFYPPGLHGWNDSVLLFTAGKLAMMHQWNGFWGVTEDPEQSPYAGKTGYHGSPYWGAPRGTSRDLPEGVNSWEYAGSKPATACGGWQFGISKYAKEENKDPAFMFMAYYTSTAIGKRLGLEGHVTGARWSVYTDPDIQANLPGVSGFLDRWGSPRRGIQKDPEIFLEGPRVPEYLPLITEIAPIVHEAYLGTATAQEALDAAYVIQKQRWQEAGYPTE